MISVLRDSVSVLVPAPISDLGGGFERRFIEQGHTPAEVSDLTSRAITGPDSARRYLRRIRVTVRDTGDITAEHRLRERGVTYQPITIRREGKGRFLTIDAEEVRS